MLERIMLFVKHNLGFIWVIVEYFNALLFKMRYGRKLKFVEDYSLTDKNGYQYRMVHPEDVDALVEFFARQPEEQYKYFNPHGFDATSVKKQFANKAFIMLGCWDGDKIIGYHFLRCFFVGKAFRGRLVDKDYQGKGIAKQMGLIHADICHKLNMRLFLTVSRDNVASFKSSQAVNNIKIVKELPDNFLLIECMYE